MIKPIGKILLSIFVLLFTLYSSPFPGFAAFKDSGWGVRPLGMGGAFTAVADDANAPLFNPGGVAQMSHKEATFMSSRLFTGLEGVDIGMNYFAYIHPLSEKAGVLGISWSSLFTPGLYREDTGNLTYSRSLDDIIKVNNMETYLGTNIKYLRHEYKLDIRTIDDPVFADGNSKDSISVDAGFVIFWPQAGISIAAASKNLNNPDVGLKTEDLVENENVAGISYYNERMPYLTLPDFTFAFDYVSRGKYIDYRAGLESWLFKSRFAVRAGVNMQEVTCGLGYKINVWSEDILVLDYAFAWPLEVEETLGSHRIGISIRFK